MARLNDLAQYQSNTSQSGTPTRLKNILESSSYQHHPEDEIYADVPVADDIMTEESGHNRVKQSPGYNTSTRVIAPPAVTRERSPPLPPLPPRSHSNTSNTVRLHIALLVSYSFLTLTPTQSSEVASSGFTSRSSRHHRGTRPIIVMVDSDGEVRTYPRYQMAGLKHKFLMLG